MCPCFYKINPLFSSCFFFYKLYMIFNPFFKCMEIYYRFLKINILQTNSEFSLKRKHVIQFES